MAIRDSADPVSVAVATAVPWIALAGIAACAAFLGGHPPTSQARALAFLAGVAVASRRMLADRLAGLAARPRLAGAGRKALARRVARASVALAAAALALAASMAASGSLAEAFRCVAFAFVGFLACQAFAPWPAFRIPCRFPVR